ncbi:MAG: FeoB-associated Cys-rich membrane protein [Lachnospiraceae bacterium]|nr:FeoB-associated Cys-rich membrane protein [Lachnospiraceae bacterium]
MSEFISTGIVILLIVLAVFLALRSRRKSKLSGASCCGDCCACGKAGMSLGGQKIKKENKGDSRHDN